MDVVGGKRRCLLFFFGKGKSLEKSNENAGIIQFSNSLFWNGEATLMTAGSISSFIRSVGPLATYVRSGNIRP